MIRNRKEITSEIETVNFNVSIVSSTIPITRIDWLSFFGKKRKIMVVSN